MNHLERERALFTHVGKSESIEGNRIRELDFSQEFEFPFAVHNQDDMFARIVDHNQQNGPMFRVAAATGRGGSILPDFSFRFIKDHPTTFSNIYAKGFGIGNFDAAIQGSGVTPVYEDLYTWWISVGSPPFFNKGNEATGITRFNDANLDAIKSRRIHELGIRTRLLICAYEFTKLPLEFGQLHIVKDLEWKGWSVDSKSGKQPVLSVWARRYNQSFRDIVDLLKRAQRTGTEQTVVRHVLDSIMSHMAVDSDTTMSSIGHEYLSARRMGAGDTSLLQLEKEGFIHMARMYARQLILFGTYGIYHGVLSDHNTLPVVEFSDNSHIDFMTNATTDKHDISHSLETNVRSLQYILERFISQLYITKGKPQLASSMQELIIGEYYATYRSLRERVKAFLF